MRRVSAATTTTSRRQCASAVAVKNAGRCRGSSCASLCRIIIVLISLWIQMITTITATTTTAQKEESTSKTLVYPLRTRYSSSIKYSSANWIRRQLNGNSNNGDANGFTNSTTSNNNTNTTEETSLVQRVLIHSFDIILSPVSLRSTSAVVFNSSELSLLHDLVEQTIVSYLQSQSSAYTLRTVLLGAISSSSSSTATTAIDADADAVENGNSGAISLATGVASYYWVFESSGAQATMTAIPSEDQVNTWVQEAIDQDLVTVLHETAEFAYLTQAVYENDAIDDNNQDEGMDPNNGNSNNNSHNNSNDGMATEAPAVSTSDPNSNHTLLIITPIVVVGVLVLASVVGMVILKRRTLGFIGGSLRRRRRRSKKASSSSPYYMEQHNAAYSIREMMEDEDFYSQEQREAAFNTVYHEELEVKVKDVDEKRRRMKEELDTTDETIQASSSASNSPPRKSSTSYRGDDNVDTSTSTEEEDKGGGESESEFTVQSESDDCLTVQPPMHGFFAAIRKSNTDDSGLENPTAPAPLAAHRRSLSLSSTIENFQQQRERERPVSIQKDMLASTWSSTSRRYLHSSNNVRVSSSSPLQSSIRMMISSPSVLGSDTTGAAASEENKDKVKSSIRRSYKKSNQNMSDDNNDQQQPTPQQQRRAVHFQPTSNDAEMGYDEADFGTNTYDQDDDESASGNVEMAIEAHETTTEAENEFGPATFPSSSARQRFFLSLKSPSSPSPRRIV